MTASANNAALLPFAPTADQIERFNAARAEYFALPAAAFKDGVLGYVDFTSAQPEGRGIDRGELQRRASLIARITLGDEAGDRARRNPNVVSLQRILREEAPKARDIKAAAAVSNAADRAAAAAIIAADNARNEAACAETEAAEAAGELTIRAAEELLAGDLVTLDGRRARPMPTEEPTADLEIAEEPVERTEEELAQEAVQEALAELRMRGHGDDEPMRPAGGALIQEVLEELAAEAAPAAAQDEVLVLEAAEIGVWSTEATAALARETIAVLTELYAPAELAEAAEPTNAPSIGEQIEAATAPLAARLAALEAAVTALQAPTTPAAPTPAPAAPRMVRAQAPRPALGGIRFRPLPPRDSSPKYITLALNDDNAAVLDALAARLGVSRVNLARYALDRLLISDGEEPIFAEGYTFGA